VAFTTLQSRLFFSIGQLLSVQVEIQGALALFDRILSTWTCLSRFRMRLMRCISTRTRRAARSLSRMSLLPISVMKQPHRAAYWQ
jgi:hypothetical protein